MKSCSAFHTQLRKILAVVQNEKKITFSLSQFCNAAKAAEKRLFKQTEHPQLNNFTNMVAKIVCVFL